VAPGQTTPLEVRLERPAAVLPQDRYVVRTYSPIRTIGGGAILDVDPPRLKRYSREETEVLGRLKAEEPGDVVGYLLERAGIHGLSRQELQQRTPMGSEALDALINELTRAEQTVPLEGGARLVHAGRLRQAAERLEAGLADYHEANPLKAGADRSEVRAMLPGADERLVQTLIHHLVDEGRAVAERTLVRLVEHAVTLGADQVEHRASLEEATRKAGVKSTTAEELLGAVGLPAKAGGELIRLMVDEGALVRLKNKHLFHREALQDAQERLVSYLEEHEQVSPAQFRDLLGVTRKVAIPLLEYFDAQRLTLRVGDNRVLRGRG
jgi:selenocysteine-specific elongation factor